MYICMCVYIYTHTCTYMQYGAIIYGSLFYSASGSRADPGRVLQAPRDGLLVSGAGLSFLELALLWN